MFSEPDLYKAAVNIFGKLYEWLTGSFRNFKMQAISVPNRAAITDFRQRSLLPTSWSF